MFAEGTKTLMNASFVVQACVSHTHNFILPFLVSGGINNSVASLYSR